MKRECFHWTFAVLLTVTFGCGKSDQANDRGNGHVLFLTSTFPKPAKPWEGETRVFLDDKTVATYKHDNLERDVSFVDTLETGCRLQLVYSDAFSDRRYWVGELWYALYRKQVALTVCRSGVWEDMKFVSWKYLDSKRRMDLPPKEGWTFPHQDEIEYYYDYQPVGNGEKAKSFFRNLKVEKGDVVTYIWPLPVNPQEYPGGDQTGDDPVYKVLWERSDKLQDFELETSTRPYDSPENILAPLPHWSSEGGAMLPAVPFPPEPMKTQVPQQEPEEK